MYIRHVKRILDLLLSLMAIIVFLPILVLIAVLVRFKLGSPIVFEQSRPGLNEKIFTLYKFRTMTDEKNDNGELLPDKDRLTTFGRFLRSTSLDELPEIWNIFRGDMSLIGPRPLLIKDLVFMTPEQRLRHKVSPGLTGWAQVNGRNNMTWEAKLNFDLEYVKNISFLLDTKIIFMTIIMVLKQEGINTEGFDTAEDLGDYLLRENKIEEIEYNNAIVMSKQMMQS